MREPGRMKAFQKMGQSSPADAGAQLENVHCPALIIEGTLEPDWADPREEGEAIVAAMPAGIGKVEMIEGAGHYPHDQYPDEVVALCPPSWSERPCLGPVSHRPRSSRPAPPSPTRSGSTA